MRIKRIDLQSGETVFEDKIIKESIIKILVNGSELSNIICSPSHLDELAVGHLFSEGFIESAQEISSIKIEKDKMTVNVEFKKEPADSGIEKQYVTTSGYGQAASGINLLHGKGFKPLEKPEIFDAKIILDLFREFQNRSVIFAETGGVHAAALCSDDRIISFKEDISRHNAVDKIIGEALLGRKNGEGLYMLFSGRISSEILVKSLRFGIYLIASRSAPTDRAVELAVKTNIRLIGFARGFRLNVYN